MAETKYEPRLKTHYDEVVRKQMQEKFGYKNEMQIPALDKIVLNMGVGEAVATPRRRASLPRIWRNRRSEAGHHQGPQVDRDLQGA
jgi:hypothetical protein